MFACPESTPAESLIGRRARRMRWRGPPDRPQARRARRPLCCRRPCRPPQLPTPAIDPDDPARAGRQRRRPDAAGRRRAVRLAGGAGGDGPAHRRGGRGRPCACSTARPCCRRPWSSARCTARCCRSSRRTRRPRHAGRGRGSRALTRDRAHVRGRALVGSPARTDHPRRPEATPHDEPRRAAVRRLRRLGHPAPGQPRRAAIDGVLAAQVAMATPLNVEVLGGMGFDVRRRAPTTWWWRSGSRTTTPSTAGWRPSTGRWRRPYAVRAGPTELEPHRTSATALRSTPGGAGPGVDAGRERDGRGDGRTRRRRRRDAVQRQRAGRAGDRAQAGRRRAAACW